MGLKASNALGLSSRSPQKILMQIGDVLEVLKIAHNVVRSVNRYLADEMVDRWVEKGVLLGDWTKDRVAFTALFNLFCLKGQDAYQGIAYRAYRQYQKAVVARNSAILARVPAAQ